MNLKPEDQDNIFELIVTLMENAQKIKKLSGQERKNIVMLQLSRYFEKLYGDSVMVEAMLFFADYTIDGIISIANKDLSLKSLSRRCSFKCK